MTPEELNARRERLRHRREIVSPRLGLTVAELALLDFVRLEDRPLELFVPYARGLCSNMGLELAPTEIEVALAALLDRGLVQVIDDAARDRITAMLDADPAIGPTEGLPRNGTVHLTQKGVTLSDEARRERDRLRTHPRWFAGLLAAPLYDGNRCTIYSVYLCQAIKFARDLESYRISVPERVGPWRCRWYEKYPCGFRVECEFPEIS